MEINLETLVPYDRLNENPDEVLELVDDYGKVILLRNNTPAYVILRADDAAGIKPNGQNQLKKTDCTLQDAMRQVLRDTGDRQMHAADLAEAIYQRGLYYKKDGTKAEYNQIRARCEHYPNMFETLPGNMIKLNDAWIDESPVTKIRKEESTMSNHRCIFVNISYCYDGTVNGSFRYVVETGDACEKYNFQPIEINGRKECWGFFEPGFTKGGYDNGGRQRAVGIERIDPSANNSIFIDNVTVIWCAQIPEIGHSAIIGWYKNARVYRMVQQMPAGVLFGRGDERFGYIHNVEAPADNCVLLPREEFEKSEWLAPRKRANGIGFGQSNMWYADEAAANDYVESVLKRIECYN